MIFFPRVEHVLMIKKLLQAVDYVIIHLYLPGRKVVYFDMFVLFVVY